jgi:hypothetical protein
MSSHTKTKRATMSSNRVPPVGNEAVQIAQRACPSKPNLYGRCSAREQLRHDETGSFSGVASTLPSTPAQVAQAAHELVIGWRYRSKAVVLIIRDRRGEYLEVMRAPHKLSYVCGAHRGTGSDGLGKKPRARKRRRCRRRQWTCIDGGELVVVIVPARHEEALSPRAEVVVKQRPFAVTMEPP